MDKLRCTTDFVIGSLEVRNVGKVIFGSSNLCNKVYAICATLFFHESNSISTRWWSGEYVWILIWHYPLHVCRCLARAWIWLSCARRGLSTEGRALWFWWPTMWGSLADLGVAQGRGGSHQRARWTSIYGWPGAIFWCHCCKLQRPVFASTVCQLEKQAYEGELMVSPSRLLIKRMTVFKRAGSCLHTFLHAYSTSASTFLMGLHSFSFSSSNISKVLTFAGENKCLWYCCLFCSH